MLGVVVDLLIIKESGMPWRSRNEFMHFPDQLPCV